MKFCRKLAVLAVSFAFTHSAIAGTISNEEAQRQLDQMKNVSATDLLIGAWSDKEIRRAALTTLGVATLGVAGLALLPEEAAAAATVKIVNLVGSGMKAVVAVGTAASVACGGSPLDWVIANGNATASGKDGTEPVPVVVIPGGGGIFSDQAIQQSGLDAKIAQTLQFKSQQIPNTSGLYLNKIALRTIVNNASGNSGSSNSGGSGLLGGIQPSGVGTNTTPDPGDPNDETNAALTDSSRYQPDSTGSTCEPNQPPISFVHGVEVDIQKADGSGKTWLVKYSLPQSQWGASNVCALVFQSGDVNPQVNLKDYIDAPGGFSTPVQVDGLLPGNNTAIGGFAIGTWDLNDGSISVNGIENQNFQGPGNAQ